MGFLSGRIIVIAGMLLSSLCPPAFADSGSNGDGRTMRARLSTHEAMSVTPLQLQGGATLTVISPERWDGIATKLISAVASTHSEYTILFGELPPFVTSVRLMDREAFLAATGAPYWTNALYFRDEIMIPLSNPAHIDLKDLVRSVRHEYTHAVLHALSNGRCPGWLDEGLAQWAEGAENPALPRALSSWLKERSPVPLSYLQGGFTKLDPAMVAAAYAQALYSANLLVESFGFQRIRNYLELLHNNKSKSEAFNETFGLSEASFEKTLTLSLNEWKKNSTNQEFLFQ